MAHKIANQYAPDGVSRPGETLAELLAERQMSQSELAERTGRPHKTINEIIKGKATITSETALQFEKVLGVPASFWANREQHYRECLARQRDAKSLASQTQWLKTVPYRSMMQLGWIPSTENKIQILQNVLTFFGVASTEAWKRTWGDCKAIFRKTSAFKSSPGAMAAWLRKGELESQSLPRSPFDEGRFITALSEIRGLTRQMPENFARILADKCVSAGVQVVFIPELPGTCAWGATRWMTPTTALLQLSLRYKTDDHFWFTFYHEAGHILLHGKRGFFIENKKTAMQKPEAEANEFACDWLIPPAQYQTFLQSGLWNGRSGIERFAAKTGIAPGIVVGRLQHDGRLRHDQFFYLKKKLGWVSGK